MPALEVFDTVVLKANRQLVGIVDRTHHENNGPLQDTLIIAHVEVDEAAVAEFKTTNAPPKHHVLIRFSNEAQGHSLVHENDVILIDRSFALGDIVKNGDGYVLGTITSVRETYNLQPVWTAAINLQDLTPAAMTFDTLTETSTHVCTSDCPFGVLADIEHPLQTHLLHKIPGEELKKAEDVLEADYVIQDDWLGVVEELDLVVIILLEDESIVMVKDSDDLFIPIPEYGKPFVPMSDFDDIARPDLIVTLPGWPATIAPNDFQCGQMVITNQRNLRSGRWLRGQYNPNVKPQGRILDVRTKSMDVRWLACNPFIPERARHIIQPHIHTTLYENMATFPRGSELRTNKHVTIYDHGRSPRVTESRIRDRENDNFQASAVRSTTDFRIGDQVKFRDQAGAALKYQGVQCSNGKIHGRFDRIPLATTFGFDVNELKIISSQQEVTVLWPDGTSSIHLSKTLVKFTLFEPELAPADLVVAREGMKQIIPSAPNSSVSNPLLDFNEMKFFENPHDLLPKSVGVVQNVNQAERVAQVRWFADPKIRLHSYGHVLDADSRFGRLSDIIEDVSLYEIMTFPALYRRLKDVVVIPPGSISLTTVELIRKHKNHTRYSRGQTSLSQINQYETEDLLLWLQSTAFAALGDTKAFRIVDSASYRSHHSTDWVGEIVSLGQDGIVTVRLSTREGCQDVRIEHDQILCLIDDAAIGGTGLMQGSFSEDIDMGDSLDGSETADSASTISEIVEYEGGERLDSDSGDDNWEDADDEDILTDAKPTSIVPDAMSRPSADLQRVQQDGQLALDAASSRLVAASVQQPHQVENLGSCLLLRSSLPSSEPPSFAVLERDPPADQYQNFKEFLPSSSAFLKRVVKEHRILASSLPKGEIFVRTYEGRLDLLRCLILGPADTPYEHAPFLIDLQLGKNFPRDPPVAHFHSWTSGLGRINPNLYEEGKICLSLLGTWPGKAEHEGWSENATLLQLLVSLQGLVFVRHPFYNEAGFEGYAEDQAYSVEALRYNEKAYVMARGFVKHALASPVEGLEDVLAWRYLPHTKSVGLLYTVISRSYSLIERSEKESSNEELVDGIGSSDDKTTVFLRPLSRGAIVMLRKTIRSLETLTADPEDTDMSDAAAA